MKQRLKKLVDYYINKKSLREMTIDDINYKNSNNIELTSKEDRIIKLFHEKSFEMKDYMYLSKNMTYDKINILLKIDKIVICDLSDHYGRIGVRIKSIENKFEDSTSIINLYDGTKHSMSDRFLYNLIYDNRNEQYSLIEQDEYFEKIEHI